MRELCKKKATAMRNRSLNTILIAQTIALLAYTALAFRTEGANLVGVLIHNLASLNWSGQFNLDFLCYLMLSGLWIMWRNKFSASSILVGTAAMILGTLFFAPYVLWLLHRENGDLQRVLIGNRR